MHNTEYTRDANATVLGDVRALVDKASPNFFIFSVQSAARINWAVAGEVTIAVARRKSDLARRRRKSELLKIASELSAKRFHYQFVVCSLGKTGHRHGTNHPDPRDF